MKVRIADYPQLFMIASAMAQDAVIGEDAALALYEQHWRVIDLQGLTARERGLIEHLANRDACGTPLR